MNNHLGWSAAFSACCFVFGCSGDVGEPRARAPETVDTDPADTDPADTDALGTCPGVDLVFVMDTSLSLEDEAAALCAVIDGIEADLVDRGLADLRVVRLGIVEKAGFSDQDPTDPPGPAFSCLEDTVYRVLGGDGTSPLPVPGNPPAAVTIDGVTFDPTVLDPKAPEAEEFWGSSVALLADGFAWSAGDSIRIVVPILDESPMTGSAQCFPVDDAVVDNAIDVASANRVIVSPVVASQPDRDECIPDLAERLALGTGGSFTVSVDAGADLPPAIVDIVEDACASALAP